MPGSSFHTFVASCNASHSSLVTIPWEIAGATMVPSNVHTYSAGVAVSEGAPQVSNAPVATTLTNPESLNLARNSSPISGWPPLASITPENIAQILFRWPMSGSNKNYSTIGPRRSGCQGMGDLTHRRLGTERWDVRHQWLPLLPARPGTPSCQFRGILRG